MTLSSEEEEADVPKISAVFVNYFNGFLRALPPFTGQIVVLFCLLPVSTSVAIFLVTAVLNFGVALIAQTISCVAILLFLVPCLAVSLVCAVATAHVLHIAQSLYLRFFHVEKMQKLEKLNYGATEVEEKLKIC